MNTTDSIKAIALAVATAFPEAEIHADKIENGAEGAFYINAIDVSNSTGIGCRRSKNASFDVMYFVTADDTLAFVEWADTMAEALREFRYNGRVFRAVECTARPEDMVFHYIFNLNTHYIDYERGETMNDLEVSIESNTD